MIQIPTKESDQYLVFLITASFMIGCTPLLNNIYLYIALWISILPYLVSHLPNAINRHKALVVAILLFSIQNLLYRAIGLSSASWGRYPGYLLSFVPLFLMLQVQQCVSYKHKKKLFWIVVALMIFNIGDSIRLSILYPYLNVDSIREYKDLVATINLGGSTFFTCALFFADVCYIIFLNVKQKRLKLVMLSCVLFSGYYLIFYTAKASVVVYYLLSIFLITYAKIAKKKAYFYITLFITLFVIIPVVEIYEDIIIRYILYLSPSSRLSSRLVTLINFDSDYGSTSSISARENLWMISLKTWFSNVSSFLFGIGDHYTTDSPEKTGIGQHSELIDSFARYGVIGMLLIYYILKNSFKYINTIFEKKYQLQIYTVFIIYIMCGFTKKIFITNIACVIFIFLPLALIYLNSNVVSSNGYKKNTH